jgi:hypothetical protein
MKNHFCWILLSFLACSLTAQESGSVAHPKHPVRIGLLAGANMSSIFFTETGSKFPTGSIMGIRLGLITDWSLTEKWSIRSGVDIQSKGGRYDWVSHNGGRATTARPVYLEFPAVLTYTGKWLFGGVGPTIALGIGGKMTETGWYYVQDGTETRYNNKRPVVWGKAGNPIDFRWFEAGLRAEGGVRIRNYRIGASIGWGLTTVSNFEKRYNTVLGLFAGYMFKQKA